ncbi:MAG: PIN domain-containing protein [Proteobacteria bacterium]|nr:PIN domain-containing protein [Pseudomonadota bacterium]
MTDKLFVDTNILIYAHDLDAGEKQETAAKLLKTIWGRGNGIISTQVLQEFYVNVTRKISSPLTPIKARSIIENYFVWSVQTISPESILAASEIEECYRISFWDAMIITSARSAGASQVITEDMNHGQKIEGILIKNPFRF